MPNNDLLQRLIELSPEERALVLSELTDRDADRLWYDWDLWARPKQLPPPGDWRTWLLSAGRGFGKTRTGAEWVRGRVERGQAGRVALVAPTAADARDTMIEGESGLLAICPPWNMPKYEPSKRRVTWPNGAIATSYSADEPDRLRGPQHDAAWCDELAAWRYAEAWDNLQLGLRLGDDPRAVVTTTPKRVKLYRDLLAKPTTVVTRGTTYENIQNLAAAFAEQIITQYEGTRLGRQEIYADLLEDSEGALWSRAKLEELRVREAPQFVRVVVAIDPAITSGEESNETGIIVAGLGYNGHGYIIEDQTCRTSPDGWGRRAVDAYHRHQADRIVAEVNQGGDMVEHVIRTVDATVSYRKVHATRGKYTRAEPIAALYEQGRVHHVGYFAHLEDQMCSWEPGDESPDRLDAAVWALTELMLGSGGVRIRQKPAGL